MIPAINATSYDSKYFYGFDYLRIISCFFIVGWHLKLFGWDNILINPESHATIPTFADVIYANLFLMAVPLFLLISIFLFIHNRKNKPDYFKKRIFYLIIVYLFWTVIYSIIYQNGLKTVNILNPAYIMSGAGSVGYFLFSLIVLVVLTELLIDIRKYLSENQFVVLNIFLFCFSLFLLIFRIPLSNMTGYLGIYFLSLWSPINFLPYPFIAFIIMNFFEKDKLVKIPWKLFAILTFIIIVISATEWYVLPDKVHYLIDGMSITPYARLSIVVSSILVFLLFLGITNESPRIIKKFSELTMGIFLIHSIIIFKLPEIWPELYMNLTNMNQIAITFIFVVSASAIVTYCIKKVGIV